MELKIGDRVRVKESFIKSRKTLKKGLTGKVIGKSGIIICIEFDEYIDGHYGGVFGSIGKNGYCWCFINKDKKYFELIKEKNMELKDIILKKGDIIYYKDGSEYCIRSKNMSWVKSENSYNPAIRIERPIKYETIYEASKEILDKEEKEYLEGVIRPFKDRVDNIEKISVMEEHISIELTNGEVTNLPYFKINTMYKGMEANKEYTLEELGLFKGE